MRNYFENEVSNLVKEYNLTMTKRKQLQRFANKIKLIPNETFIQWILLCAVKELLTTN